MDGLVAKVNAITMSHFNIRVKDFIEKGVDKGRHYFYLRDVLGLTDRKFEALMKYLGIDVEKVKATKADFYKLFDEPDQENTEIEEAAPWEN